MRILITGGAGYVGSHCLRALCEAGHQATVFDNLAAGHREAVDLRARLIVGDLADQALLDRTFEAERFDAVMHFAAFADVGESVRDPLRYYRNNLGNTLTLIETMKHHVVKNIVFSSSCAVYGIPSQVPIPEDSPKVPISPYGRTKLGIEWMLEDCAAAWGLSATALRYFNAAGAAADGTLGEDHDPETHLIPRVLQVALGRADFIQVYGTDYPTPDGTCIRDYVHVEDLAMIHRIAMETPQPGRFRAYNVGTGRGVSVQQVIDAARQLTGKPIKSIAGERRPGDPPALFADASRAAGELGWQPRFAEIESMIETAWKWHRSRPRGFSRAC